VALNEFPVSASQFANTVAHCAEMARWALPINTALRERYAQCLSSDPASILRREQFERGEVCNWFATLLFRSIVQKTTKGRGLGNRLKINKLLAERVGFEPTVRLPVQRFSRPSRSTTPAPLRPGSCSLPIRFRQPLAPRGIRFSFHAGGASAGRSSGRPCPLRNRCASVALYCLSTLDGGPLCAELH
jgi:hypothetical protein